MMFRTPLALLLLLLVPVLFGLWLRRGGRVSASVLALRLLILSLIVLAIANPVMRQTPTGTGTTVLLVDQSDSLGAEGKTALSQRAAEIARASERTRTLYFGADVVAAADAEGTPARADQTDLAGALEAAAGLLGAGGGNIVLLSDGGQTRGDALAQARTLAAAGITVDTYYQPIASQPDAWIAGISAPPTLRQGETFAVQIQVGSTDGGPAYLQLSDGTTVIARQDVDLLPGQNSFTLNSTAGQPGVAQLQASISAEPDTIARNNTAAATALVAPPPNILLVESANGGAAPLRVALRDQSINTTVVQARALPSQLSDLDQFDGVVLVDVPAGEMTLDQMTVLREFVRSEGRGLVATGGRSSFTLGAYKDTPLEEVLPVQMTPPPRPQRGQVTLLLIIDQSASMGSTGGISKLDMAKESAILATESLRDEDRLGVLAFDNGQAWTVPFQQLGTGLSLGQIQEQIGAISLGGGTDIYAALATGMRELGQQPGDVRHAVLLTDGRSFVNERSSYRTLLQQARAQNMTLSSIAIGDDSDIELLRELANLGAGRYHFASQPEDIPRLTLLESEIASTEPQIEGDFRADLAAPHPMMRDFATNDIPRLEGYVATTLKDDAELVLSSPEDDPVLSVWQYGLGRAVAWTPSIEEPWAQSWSSWPEYGQFWAQIIRYTLPEPDSGPLQVRAAARGDTVLISADSFAPGNTTVDLADTQVTIRLPDGSDQIVSLRQTAPGHYETTVTLPGDGAYAINVAQRKNNSTRNASIGYVQRYPAEYLPSANGEALLRAISAATGGQVREQSGPAIPVAAQPLLATNTGIWTWLLLLAALLWPFEIALRRGWLRFSRE